MNTTELRETTINVMSKVIVNTNPNMTILRLYNDNTFVIYANVNVIEGNDNIHKHTVLIDIVTEKTKPEFFKTIKKIIKALNKDEELKISESKYFLSLVDTIEVKDKQGNVIENLIEFDQRAFSTLGDSDIDDIDPVDEFNIMRMLYNCAELVL